LFQGISCVFPLVVALVICLIGLIQSKRLGKVNAGNLRGMCLWVMVVYLFAFIPAFQAVHFILSLFPNETFFFHRFSYASRLNPLLYSFSNTYNIIKMLR
jgi:hypothetical protein